MVNYHASRRYKRCGFDPWARKILWVKKWQPTPVFLPKKSHGRRGLESYSPWGHKRIRHDLVTKHHHHHVIYYFVFLFCFWKSLCRLLTTSLSPVLYSNYTGNLLLPWVFIALFPYLSSYSFFWLKCSVCLYLEKYWSNSKCSSFFKKFLTLYYVYVLPNSPTRL